MTEHLEWREDETVHSWLSPIARTVMSRRELEEISSINGVTESRHYSISERRKLSSDAPEAFMMVELEGKDASLFASRCPGVGCSGRPAGWVRVLFVNSSLHYALPLSELPGSLCLPITKYGIFYYRNCLSPSPVSWIKFTFTSHGFLLGTSRPTLPWFLRVLARWYII